MGNRRLGAASVALLALLVVMVAAIGAKTFGLALPPDSTPVPWEVRVTACDVALRAKSGRALGNPDYYKICGPNGSGLPPENPRDWPKEMLPVPNEHDVVINCYRRIDEDPRVERANRLWNYGYLCDGHFGVIFR